MSGILITGGSGFLGRALARRLLSEGYERVCIYSRGEHTQAKMFDDFDRHPNLRMLIGDVRDQPRLAWAMRSCDTVIHASALKRVEVGERNPIEMIKTNVNGATNVVEAAIAEGVERAVLVSSDKAYQPISPYGTSKAMAESLFLAANNTVVKGTTRFAVVRYGNVAGSTGSVIPRWRERIAAGLPVEITDPDATRFWMTIDRAVDFVLSAADCLRPLMVPSLPAFRVGDLVEALGVVKFVVTGLPQHEKKHECMAEGNCSNTARRMTVDELREALTHV